MAKIMFCSLCPLIFLSKRNKQPTSTIWEKHSLQQAIRNHRKDRNILLKYLPGFVSLRRLDSRAVKFSVAFSTATACDVFLQAL